MKKIKVLHVLNGDIFGGAEKLAFNIGVSLSEFGLEDPVYFLIKKGTFASIVKKRFKCYEGSSFFKSYVLLSQVITSECIDIIHVHTVRSAFLVLIYKFFNSKSRFIYHIHSHTDYETHNRFRDFTYSFFERSILLRFADKVVADSFFLKNFLSDTKKFSSKIHVIYACFQSFLLNVNKKRNLTPFKVGMIAFHRYRKGTHILIESLALLSKRGFEIPCIIFGKFENQNYYNLVKKLISFHNLKNVSFKEFSTDVASFYNEINLCVLPSLPGEGIPLVIYEAMSFSVPVLSSSVHGVDEIVLNNQTGFLVKPNDVEQLASKILEVLNDQIKASSIADEASFRMKSSFSKKFVVRKMVDLYESIL